MTDIPDATTNNAPRGPLTPLEIVAATVSTGTLIAAAVFWFIQIQGVLEMLRLAYG